MIARALPGAVFDCTIFAQALINPAGPAGKCITIAQKGEVQLFVSGYCVQEIRELPGKLPIRLGITQLRVDRFIQELAKYSRLIDPVPKWFSYARDEDDAPYVDLAYVAGADFLVARDRDLLDLIHEPEGKELAQKLPNLRILDPYAFLHVIVGSP